MKDDISWMPEEFLKEIIMSVLITIAAILYLVLNIGGRFVLFIIITAFAADKLANKIKRYMNDKNIFVDSGGVSLGDAVRDDYKGVK